MVLLFLTLLPISVLIVLPIIQRLTGLADAWQGQVTQGALWALLPLGMLWTLQMLDSGRGFWAIIPAIAGLSMLILGSSGGWPALISGRLLQGAFALLALLSFELSSGLTALAAASLMALAAVLADTALDRLGPAPEQPLGFVDSPEPLESPELSGPLVGGIKPAPPKPAPAASPQPVLSDRPPLPPPGAVTRWTTEQAEQAARLSEEAQQPWMRPRRLDGQGSLSGSGDRRAAL